MKRMWALILIVLIATGCATAPVSGRTQLMMMPISADEEMGQQAFAQLLSAYGKKGKLIDPKTADATEQKYLQRVRQVGTRILDATGWRKEYPWKWTYAVIRDDTVNAGMFPGGKMVVYTGMLNFAKDDDELAAVIGHEMGHAIARHGPERVSQVTLAEVGLAALGAALETNQYGPLITAAAGLGAQVGVLLPFSRTHEEEADYIGVLAMAKAGYDPRAAIRLWTRMEQKHGSGGPEFLSTHPNPGTRVKNLEELLPYALTLRQNPSLPLPKTREELPNLLKP